MRDSSDTQEYQCVILNCYLYIKVAKMSDAIYKEFHSRFLSGKETLKYQFRRLNVKEFKIPTGGSTFVSGELFPDSEVPSKLFFVLVFNESKLGKQTTNPFHFWRKFLLVKNVNTIENLTGSIQSTYIRENLAAQMAKMRGEIADDLKNELRVQFQNLQLLMQPSTGQNPSGATSETLGTQVPPCLPQNTIRTRSRVTGQSTSQQAIFRSSADDDTVSEGSFADAVEDDGQSPLANPNSGPQLSNSGVEQQQQQQQQLQQQPKLTTTELPVYVTKLEVLLNSAQLDQVQ
jgi:hypothetical protein